MHCLPIFLVIRCPSSELLPSWQEHPSDVLPPPEQVAALSGGRITPEMARMASSMMSQMGPDELQRMMDMAARFGVPPAGPGSASGAGFPGVGAGPQGAGRALGAPLAPQSTGAAAAAPQQTPARAPGQAAQQGAEVQGHKERQEWATRWQRWAGQGAIRWRTLR